MKLSPFPQPGPEISDEIVSFDRITLARKPVSKQEVISTFLGLGNQRAARIVEAIPAKSDVLDPRAVDELLVNAHCEMQRISEEFQHGPRVLELLRPLLSVLKEERCEVPVRIVDIGCGTGFIMRWLAAKGNLGGYVELIGVDFNAALIREAERLAAIEGLRCSFLVADAFAPAHPATIYLSTGVLHHFPVSALAEFFGQHEHQRTCAFLHFDFQRTPFAPFGSWLFHVIRMRQPMARHDGVLSTIRVFSGEVLLKAAREGAPGFVSAIYGARLWRLPIPRVFHTVVGIRPTFRERFVHALGSRAVRLGEFR